MKFLLYALCAVIGYFLGNISAGLLIARRMGNIDIRDYGSGNAGTTNVLRTLGWLPSMLTLIGDALKGALAALISLAKEKGYRIVLDQVRRDNRASIRLHEKLGFETDGYIYRNRKNNEVVLYLKIL